jgi:hypothetical protein
MQAVKGAWSSSALLEISSSGTQLAYLFIQTGCLSRVEWATIRGGHPVIFHFAGFASRNQKNLLQISLT